MQSRNALERLVGRLVNQESSGSAVSIAVGFIRMSLHGQSPFSGVNSRLLPIARRCLQHM